MQRARLNRPHEYFVLIATLAIAFLATGVLPLAMPEPASAATLDRMQQTGKLTLGYRADARPFSYKDESGNAAGYAVGLCQQVAEKIKSDQGLSTLTVEWVPVTVEDQFQAVRDGKVDLLCGAAETLTSRKDVDFSVPIFPGGIGALLRANAPVGLKEVLSGRPPSGPLWRGYPAQILEKQTLCAVGGTPSEKWVSDSLDKLQLTASIVPVKSYEEGVQRALDGSCNVFFADRSILLDEARRGPSARDFTVLKRQFTYAPLALALERNDADFRLVVDRALSQLFGSQEFHDLYVKWFGKPDESIDTFFKFSTLPE
jgi:ABC-type amino acid transport substrate-binding protein